MTSRSRHIVFWSAVGAFAAVIVFLTTMVALVLFRPETNTPAFDLGTPFELVDFNGDPITEAAFDGHPSILFFGFTHCPEICPLTVYEMTNWFEELGPAGEEIMAYFVSVDPERDTPEILADYLKPQSDRVIGITGPADAVAAMQKGWRVYSKKVPLEDGDYTVDHTALLYLLDRDGKYHSHINYGAGAEEALRKLRALLDS